MSEAFLAAIECHRRGDIAGARAAAQRAVAVEPRHVDALHFLGMLEAAAGRPVEARRALERAVAADASGPQLTSLARLLGAAEPAALAAQHLPPPAGAAGDEYLHRRGMARLVTGDAAGGAADLVLLAGRRPGDRQVLLAAARALADAGENGEAERLYRALLRLLPGEADALLGLVGLLEALGRGDEIAPAFADLAPSADPRLEALGAAFAARAEGRFDAALARLDEAAGLLPEGTQQQLRGEIADRAGQAAVAMAAFAAMNRADAAVTPEWREGIRRYRAMIAAGLHDLVEGRPLPASAETRPPPLFLLGFPRSGTTLFDTFLMGHSGVEVHEERPFLDAAAGYTNDAEAARTAYWRALDAEVRRPAALQVDKYPLASARAPLLHAMFPEARYLFVLRDPRDVVLSCFMTRFRLNWGVASFLDLAEAAKTYDAVMTIWTRSHERLDLDVHEVRYEELVADPPRVLQAAAAFAGLSFEPAMLDHRGTARARGMISTPSNAQVVQPIYQRASGRWRRYRDVLEPLRPLLDPWCARFGYEAG